MIIIAIRGHIRESFNNNILYTLIKNISELYEIQIYIQTWNIIANNISYRTVKENTAGVSNDLITRYFADLSPLIKNIQILDDTKINHIGKNNGFVGATKMPLIGWKNMWYGQLQLFEKVHNTISDKNTLIINTRFDIATNLYNSVTINRFIEFIKENRTLENGIIFERYREGCDNLFIGPICRMYSFISHFYTNLDNIIENAEKFYNQERYVPYAYGEFNKIYS